MAGRRQNTVLQPTNTGGAIGFAHTPGSCAMSTYADDWNARARQNGAPVPDGPVRWTIDSDSWEQEHLMDTEVAIEPPIESDPTSPQATPPYHLQMAGPPPTHSAPLPVPTSGSGRVHTYFLVDTNVLMTNDCLKLLQKLLDVLLAHNMAVLCNGKQGALAALLVPRIVIHELEGLKSRRNAGPDGKRRCAEAQAGSRLILSALKWQNEAQASRGLPKSAWALHVQTIEHALERERSLNNDEKIVRLAAAIQKECPVMLLTHDVIASVSAEAEGVTTFDLQQILGSCSEARADATTFAQSFVEQWSSFVMQQHTPPASAPDAIMSDERPTEGKGWRLCTDGTEDARAVIEILDDDAEMEDLDFDPPFDMGSNLTPQSDGPTPSEAAPAGRQPPSIPTSGSRMSGLSAPTSLERAMAPLPKRAHDLTAAGKSSAIPSRARPSPPPPPVPSSGSRKRSVEKREEPPSKRADRDVIFLVSSDEESDNDEPVVVSVAYASNNLVPQEGDIKLDASYFGRRGGLRLDERIGRAKLAKSQRRRLRAALKSLKAVDLFPGKDDPGDRSDAVEAFTAALQSLAERSTSPTRRVAAFRLNDQTRVAFQPRATSADIPRGMPTDLTPVAATFELVFSPRATSPSTLSGAGTSESKYASRPTVQATGQRRGNQAASSRRQPVPHSPSHSRGPMAGSTTSKWAKP